MAATDTEVCNLALLHIGVTKAIATLATEKSTEAAACRVAYEPARDSTFRDFSWPFATKSADLALVQADPDDYYAFSYRVPADCARVIKLWSGVRNDSRQSRVPYKIVNDAGGSLIFTDLEDARVEYTKIEDDMTLWPSDFTLAVSYKIGYMTAPALTKGDPFKLGDKCQQNYERAIAMAKATALNEGQAEEDVESEAVRARG